MYSHCRQFSLVRYFNNWKINFLHSDLLQCNWIALARCELVSFNYIVIGSTCSAKIRLLRSTALCFKKQKTRNTTHKNLVYLIYFPTRYTSALWNNNPTYKCIMEQQRNIQVHHETKIVQSFKVWGVYVILLFFHYSFLRKTFIPNPWQAISWLSHLRFV